MDAPIQLSLPLPRSMDTRIYIQLTVKSKAVVLFLTTASAEEATSPTPLGSFVYALPDVSVPPVANLILVSSTYIASEIQSVATFVDSSLYG